MINDKLKRELDKLSRHNFALEVKYHPTRDVYTAQNCYDTSYAVIKALPTEYEVTVGTFGMNAVTVTLYTLHEVIKLVMEVTE